MMITKPSQIPETEHWQIIIFDTVAVNDGWGGACNQIVTNILVFTDEDDVRKEILGIEQQNAKSYYNRKEYRVQKVTPCVVKTELIVRL